MPDTKEGLQFYFLLVLICIRLKSGVSKQLLTVPKVFQIL